ncbi:DUF3710 domain-containing protein [Phytoactinopolyspora alkaliphila]|uniref:DUF3710 domain-containing protein n=1 Tax=Phytoactinopolyspora alkaliphila TaxID=1783498 RepID=A0A6N9YGP2_9ACTN|nr:DUF3710 domain-containing protein [Phytoactinopolyspora alkaliphila]
MVFRRRRRDDESAGQVDAGTEPAQDDHAGSPSGADSPPRQAGPFDVSEIAREALSDRIDLGGILVKGVEGLKIQLQVDKRTGRGTSALLAVGDAAVQLVAVAAPRSAGMWEQAMLEITADAERRGGAVQEGSGPFGTEVRVVLPVKTQDGKQGRQASRISGIDGPRWMLRATFLGKAITDANAFQRLVQLVRDVVVVRGDGPMPPGEVIALRPPPRGEAAGEATEGAVEDGAATITDTRTAEAVPTDTSVTGTSASGTAGADDDDAGSGPDEGSQR